MKITKTEYFGIQRKMVAYTTTESWKKIPHAAYSYEPDVTKLFEIYKKINIDRNKENKITFNTIMLKIIAEGLKAAPGMNAHIRYNSTFVTGKIETIKDINISMPTILPNGEMMTINLRNFGNKTLENMRDYINDIRRRAEKTNLTEAMYRISLENTLSTLKRGHILSTITKVIGANIGHCKVNHLRGKAKREYKKIPETQRLTEKDFEPGTVLITNIGSIYSRPGEVSLLDIIPPMVSAFAIGAVQKKPVIYKNGDNEEIVARLILPICIAFDHRALDFGDVLPFFKVLDDIFENPEVIETWINNSVSEVSVL